MAPHAHQCPTCAHIYSCIGRTCEQELRRRDRRCTPGGYTDAQELETGRAWHKAREDSDGTSPTYNTR